MPAGIIVSKLIDGAPGFLCGPCVTGVCHARWGDTLNWALTGLSSCDCFLFGLEGGGSRDAFVTLTGLNTSGTATWDGSFWQAYGIGSYTITLYTSSDGTCSGDILDTASGSAQVLFSCDPATGLFSGAMFGSAARLLGTDYGPQFFSGDGSFAVGGPGGGSRYTDSGWCGALEGGNSFVPAFGGTMTLAA